MQKKIASIAAAAVIAVATAQDSASLDRVRRGVQAYLQRNYAEVTRLLTDPARAGDSTSTYVMGALYAGGNGVSRDEIRAHSLLTSAEEALSAKPAPAIPVLSFDVNSRAKKALGDLAGKLDQAKVRLANVLRTGEEIDQNGEGCDYGGSTVRGRITTFAPESSAVAMVHEIVSHSGLKPNFDVRAGNVPNALAAIRGSTRYIVYNPTFMEQVGRAVGENRFSLQSILAHEVGHHLQGHTLQAGGSRPPIELEADEYSGFIMAKMGATLPQAQAAMARIAGEADGPTHPGRARRLQAIANGYNRGRGDTRTRRTPVQPPPTEDPWETRRRSPSSPYPNDPIGPYPPSSARIATVCATSAGSCRMGVPVPVGSPCYCPTAAGGYYTGVTR